MQVFLATHYQNIKLLKIFQTDPLPKVDRKQRTALLFHFSIFPARELLFRHWAVRPSIFRRVRETANFDVPARIRFRIPARRQECKFLLSELFRRLLFKPASTGASIH